MESLSPIGWAIRPFKKYATFSGRAPRAELWWFTLFVMLFYFVAMLLLGGFAGFVAATSPGNRASLGRFGLMAIFLLIFWLVMFIPSLAVQVRRLHDINRSGWWLGGFWLLYLAYMGAAFAPRFAAASTAPSMVGVAGIGIIALAFFAYSIVLLVFWCKRGSAGPNRFGDDPYGANIEQVFA